MSESLRRIRRGEWLLLALLAAWGLAPLALLVLHSVRAGVALTGADGTVAPDVLQYIAWVRDAGSHGLAANLFDSGHTTHVWLHPMFTLSGAAVALGAGAIAAYLAWTPVAIAALFGGALTWARALLEPGRGRLAAVALALFLNNPLRALADGNATALSSFKSRLIQATSEPFAAGLLWGYLPSVIATALMPVCLVAAARALDAAGDRPARTPLAVAAGAGLLAAWLHPWQGVTLILISAGAAAWGRRRRELWLAVPAAATAAPLAYYAALGRFDDAWHASQAVTASFPHFPLAVLLAALAPPLLAAVPGVRRVAAASPLERMLLLWVPLALLAYFVVPYPSHALEGVGFPLAVLIVRGWRRLRVTRRAPAWVAAIALVLATAPGMAADARDFRTLVRRQAGSYYLRRDEARALRWVAAHAPPGAVVAPLPLATAIPARSGRAVWVGHAYWTPSFDARARAVQALFYGASATAARAVLDGAHPRLLVAGCDARADIAPVLGRALRARRRFGCATVYVLR